MCDNCIDDPSEIDQLIYKVIEKADMEDMVNFAEMRDEIIEIVGDWLYEIYAEDGINEVKAVIKKKFGLEV